jgi:hypothetical protein
MIDDGFKKKQMQVMSDVDPAPQRLMDGKIL